MTVLAYDETWVREPRLMVPGMQPTGRCKIVRPSPVIDFVVPGASISNSEISRNGSLSSSGYSCSISNRARVFTTGSGGYIRDLTIPVISLPFTLVCKISITSTNSRILHLTKGTSLDTISGFWVDVSGNFRIQNYDGAEDTATLASYVSGRWYSFVGAFYGTSMTGFLYDHTLGTMAEQTTSLSWTAGPDRLSFGGADWGAGQDVIGSVEYFGLLKDALIGNRAREFVMDPYQYCIPA